MLGSIATVTTPTASPLPSPLPRFTPLPNAKFCKFLKLKRSTTVILKNQFNITLPAPRCASSDFGFQNPSNSDWELGEDEIEEDGDAGSPWEGAILYRRNASVSHLEYCTTLERLGLGKVSSAVSRNRASEMGIRLVRTVNEYPDGTPVLISVDVSRRRGKLRLDGIVRTVLALNCNRCGEPAAESVYADFSLLLCEEPIKEPETINMGIIFGEEKSKDFEMGATYNEDDEDALIDLDDHLYFPPEEKTIDISKNIRDLIHVEITISATCDPNCKGLCNNCGANLNIGSCTCGKNPRSVEKSQGPLSDLRKRMVSK